MNQKIVIIGAGPSGIAAATKLIENGFTNVKILEAESRIGGRVHTVPFGANVVEVGAQFCHGIRNNAVYDLAKGHNLLQEMVIEKNENYPVFDTQGTWISKDKTKKLFQLADQILESEDINSYKGSLGNFFMEKYWEAIKDELYDDIDDELHNQFAKLMHKRMNIYNGSDTWYLYSCHEEYEDEQGPGENRIWNTNSRGYTTVLDLLQKMLPGQGEPINIAAFVQLNKEAKKISYNLKNSAAPIRIECEDGSAYEADHLICTVSLGVLKERHLSLFDPMLPRKKMDAIETISFGVVDKILLEFERPFWPSTWVGCLIMWNPEQLKLIREKEETRWLEDVTAIHPFENQPNMLLGWISGANARKMETIPAETVATQSMMLLKMLLKDCDVPDAPKNHLRSQWFTNPHFRGSYSSVSVEADAMNATHVDLAEPLFSGDKRLVIQFAGEATNEHHYSTVHGAIESGWREADRLITFLNGKK